ncbi:DNA transfer protein [Campylobacter jejuni]|uniref:plasmid mobilization protein n=1 Tax=Campylobacter jejuni TaxID=197 RepID=UPI000A223909|nr:DNA transfer protein [Campylobacter jejuni]EDA5833960.1 DNA transfer protein [Campylobacter jejuni]EDP6005366.1 DNA transfer protein [Campylobacter jejuni]MEA8965255.1 DNA transfer protein [Campylobacter jejuni]MEA8973907.1 DNA transfer protein [Campylobacter jejuni]OSM69721.1 DNA transfer protein [Campylobacter jejuni subsp. jejuni]
MNKNKRIAIRLSQNEYEYIMQKAKGHGLTISRYLRDLAMNYPITCIVDQKVAHNVLNIAGDIGRLGGLFKHWLVRNEDNKANFSNKRSYEDIDEIVDQILDLQILLKEQAKRIIQNDNQKDSKQKTE